MATWDELKIILARLAEASPGPLAGRPDPRDDTGGPPHLLPLPRLAFRLPPEHLTGERRSGREDLDITRPYAWTASRSAGQQEQLA